MKRFKLMLPAVILATAVAFTGCHYAAHEPPGIKSEDNSAVVLKNELPKEQNPRMEADNPGQASVSETETLTSESVMSSTSESGSSQTVTSIPTPAAPEKAPASDKEVMVSSQSTVPQGNCPYCNGTGHHNNAVCGTCHGTGFYEEPTTPQGNCPYCNGTGHHNNAVCGTCHGTGFYEELTTPQGNCPYCNGTGHHNNAVCGTCHGTGFYEEPAAPQITLGGCHSQNRYQNSGHHNKHHCH